MSKLLVFRHVAYEILGTLDPLLRNSGFRIKYVNFERHPDAKPNLKNYDGLIVLGGPMNVDETDEYPNLITEIDIIRQAVDEQKPVLGICLGSQLLAKALGAKVKKNKKLEIGWYDVTPTNEGKEDDLLSHFDGTEKIFQWHGDTFELPKGAVHLARSEYCANQAFKYGDNAYGFQFHLEVDSHLIERWLKVPEHKKEIENTNGEISVDNIKVQTPKHIDRLIELSNSVFGQFFDHFELKNKVHTLPSR
ncbi:MAG: amidotransferase [Candidatus Dadabacteria bacterium]|nr:amidotransferase [Candidatus Dadabacteria bacterium]NIS07217.1 amidotransferase [Candidatus Dadabacteria bacterium]NIV40924.1 amidotransferase [Candidatus Dadabacteria bacterium]NIX14356.1 amidotransferase [Candidatus Dadabacteria bacterium]NIY20874.1 amidotransferase [Candidatus Dadabacteria bacterium]